MSISLERAGKLVDEGKLLEDGAVKQLRKRLERVQGEVVEVRRILKIDAWRRTGKTP